MYKSREISRGLKKRLNECFLIHYSSSGTSDVEKDWYSSRVTSIAVLHPESSTMHSFSFHLTAEVMKIPKDQIESHYDDIEKEMLKGFYKFVQDSQGATWLHWKMSNITFGFPALAHRYRVLTGEDAPIIEDARRINLSTLVTETYGQDCVKHPQMYSLMELNGGSNRAVLSGAEEVAAFQNKEYVKLHASTMAKVYWFRTILYALLNNRVVVAKSNWGYKVNHFMELPAIKVLGFIAVLFALFQLGEYVTTFALDKVESPNKAMQPTAKGGG